MEASGASLGTVEEIEQADTLLIVGDILTRSPVLSHRINKVKYGKRGNKVIVIDPNQSHTSWFATTHLKLNHGTEAPLLAALIKIISDDNHKGLVNADLERVAGVTGITGPADYGGGERIKFFSPCAHNLFSLDQ